ncbi:hypothetical protein LV28_24685 [Pandoraea pnomenusa]|uniref:Uncharacterized protein n=1 Tax=Pandoraea pnomenusa TaxID=93220 RepID=A0A378YZY1_9BURK|nr:hypothetical protein [Pandoraea pnomenusa]AIU29340.1 hypothetical protein LV28_24685 [Pandoraea pnomenusa]SUA81989.1 Uncharacterised protein [Pandoraea pnomenusa]
MDKALIEATMTTAGNTHAILAAIIALLSTTERTPQLEQAMHHWMETLLSASLGAGWADTQIEAFEKTRALIEGSIGSAIAPKQ